MNSGLKGQSARELVDAYRHATGRPWTQPIGFAHALSEGAIDILKRAKNLADSKSAIVLAGVMAMFVCFARGAEPLKIGMVAPLTGADVESGRYQTQGAKLAAEEVNKAGGVLGRQIELAIEDDQATNPGVVLA